MKWLFATLVGLNLIVFAGMIASKIYKPTQVVAPIAPQNNVNQQPPVIINMGGGNFATPNGTPVANANNTAAPKTTAPKTDTKTAGKAVNKPNTPAANHANAHETAAAAETGTAQAKYRNCSARVSLPEDDYHRIKGLLARFPHAATRQVVEGGGEGDSQTSARMNVLFMSVSDEEASTIQGVVGRYGTLNRAPCPQ